MIIARRSDGQALVEAALLLPVLLALLAGYYACCRSAFIVSAAESAARTEALRAGRGLSDIGKKMSGTIGADADAVTVRAEAGSKSRLLPSPFPTLAGRTSGVADVTKGWREAGGYAPATNLKARCVAEASVDCWERKSASGKKVSGVVTGIVAAGILR